MKFLLIIIALMIPNIVIADNEYHNANPKWKSEFNIGQHVSVKSINWLSLYQINVVINTYKLAKTKIFKFWNLSDKHCRLLPLKIKMVRSHYELDNKKYFPYERVYADKPGEGGDIIYGRYYKVSNILFIVPPEMSKYYWRKNFAHELIHYFFDECGIRFSNSEEHKRIEKFIEKHSKFFY